MDCKEEKLLNIVLRDKEVKNFRSIINKCEDEDNSIGFKNKGFIEDEIKLLKEIKKNIE